MRTNFATENARERQRLLSLTARWTETDLTCQMANGWSVASKLAHLAFWDQYYLVLIEQWERDGFTLPSPNVDAINAVVRVLSRDVPPNAAVQLVRASAEAIDHKLETISPDLAAAIEASGRVRLLRRAMHRREHLDQIEAALRARGAPDTAVGRRNSSRGSRPSVTSDEALRIAQMYVGQLLVGAWVDPVGVYGFDPAREYLFVVGDMPPQTRIGSSRCIAVSKKDGTVRDAGSWGE